MAKLNILEFPDPRLTTVATDVENFDADLKTLVEDMTETMYAANGIGLAATQVNIHKRLLVLDVSENQDQPRVYINPQIMSQSGEQSCEEGCLSVPGIYASVERAENITVTACDVDGKTFEEELEGLHAVCVQHEMDHLIGRLFVDYLSPLKRNIVRKKLQKQRKIAAKEAAEHLVI
ncbi:MAG: peptide deformylase [Xanthomonadales bacterium]|nr:peptide deformylase [Gammaproteobacteria bacterium]MBT8072256.1 peptide deformylase [Gammaproteobacteria bacterium]MBT8076379.1 peptide deformylase [Gammaproteobacteria bacterium]NNK03096.1 peptide deformylase [Xanthomonadales bacterium]NNK98848.1 peptide deformylase [Xanthomonadales bacterium]